MLVWWARTMRKLLNCTRKLYEQCQFGLYSCNSTVRLPFNCLASQSRYKLQWLNWSFFQNGPKGDRPTLRDINEIGIIFLVNISPQIMQYTRRLSRVLVRISCHYVLRRSMPLSRLVTRKPVDHVSVWHSNTINNSSFVLSKLYQ